MQPKQSNRTQRLRTPESNVSSAETYRKKWEEGSACSYTGGPGTRRSQEGPPEVGKAHVLGRWRMNWPRNLDVERERERETREGVRGGRRGTGLIMVGAIEVLVSSEEGGGVSKLDLDLDPDPNPTPNSEALVNKE